MAASGYMGTSNQYVVYWLDVQWGAYNVAGNYTPCSVYLYAKRTNSGYTTWGSGTATLVVNGSTSAVNKEISITSNTVLVHSWSGNIGHNADGTKTLEVGGAINISGILSSNVQYWWVELPRIPRMSAWTMSPTTTDLDSNIQIRITPAASGFTHAIHYWIGAEHRYIRNWNSGDTTVNFSLPITDAVYNTTGTSLTINMYVATYSGSTLVGDNYKTLNLNIPASVKPSVNWIRLDAINAFNGYWVQGKTSTKMTAEGVTTQYGASITSLKFEGGGYQGTVSRVTDSFTTGLLTASGDFEFRVTATDSRGRTNTYSVMQVVHPYNVPVLSEALVRRCLANGTIDASGTYIKIKVSGSWTAIRGENIGGVRWRSRLVGAASWGAWANLTNNTESAALGGGSFNNEKSYDVQVECYDSFTSTPSITTIGTMTYPIDCLASGKGIAFGKVAEIPDLADFAFLANFRNQADFRGPVNFWNYPVFRTNMSIWTLGYGASHDESWLQLKNNAGKNRVGFTTGGNGNGLRVHTYNNQGTWEGFVDLLKDDITVNGNPIVSYKSERTSVHIKQSFRFYDGTAIETCATLINPMTLGTQDGGIWHSQEYRLGAWLRAFVDYPSISMTMSNAYNFWHSGNRAESPTQSGAIVFFGASGGTWNANFFIHCQGIGRWK